MRAAEPDHLEAWIAFWGSTKAETGTEPATLSTELAVDEESVTQDQFFPEKFLQAQKTKKLSSPWGDTHLYLDYDR